MPGRALSGHACTVKGSSPLLSTSSTSHSLLCLALARCSAPCRRPPLSTVVVDQAREVHRCHPPPSRCSSNPKPELPASDVGRSHLPSRCLPLTASPSTAAIRAPPTSPPRPGGPRGSVVQPRLHLCRRIPPVNIAVELSSATEFLTVAPIAAMSASSSNHPPSVPLGPIFHHGNTLPYLITGDGQNRPASHWWGKGE
jgi:hypothetical protein